MKQLRSEAFLPATVLLAGGSGYLGTLLAARLLASGITRLIVPLRAEFARETFFARLDNEMAVLGVTREAMQGQVETIEWQGDGEIGNDAWGAALDACSIDEVIHCAGCLDYFNESNLNAVNVQLTEWLLKLGRRWGVKRFTFISTSYSSGYVDSEIEEELHNEPDRDPTTYTRTKRRAEWLVAQSRLSYLILRPSILIGEWGSGRYSGKRYGLYQQWMGLERLMTDRYHTDIHTVAPHQPLNLLHQDMFQAAFLYAHRWLPNAAVCNLVSDNDSLPSMRELWDMWIEVVRPHRVHYYHRFEDVNLRAIDIRQRAYLTFAQVNLQIGAHNWRFRRDWMRALEAKGLVFHSVTSDSVSRCQARFVDTSVAMTRYHERFYKEFPEKNIQEINHYEMESVRSV